ncbi:MAG: DUF1178 family protein [Deltaproteobacteria bacterium]|jgi:hypothetical protein|nr:DUF1178 family protein [Deltaproteobacteria bacterium]
MVIFDLACSNEHRFEGWFDGLADLEGQIQKGLLSCPVCGDAQISRRPSTFGLVKSQATAAPARADDEAAEETPEKLLKRLESLSDKLHSEFADVGAEFMVEALKMHYGVSPRRNIRGQSTRDEEEILKKEGVEFMKVPLLVRKTTSPT